MDSTELRDLPLDPEVSAALREHMKRFPPVEVTSPRLTPSGWKVTHRLVFTAPAETAPWSSAFNDQIWKPALATRQDGQLPTYDPGRRESGGHPLVLQL
jgi:hypothetical protein